MKALLCVAFPLLISCNLAPEVYDGWDNDRYYHGHPFRAPQEVIIPVPHASYRSPHVHAHGETVYSSPYGYRHREKVYRSLHGHGRQENRMTHFRG